MYIHMDVYTFYMYIHACLYMYIYIHACLATKDELYSKYSGQVKSCMFSDV